MNSERLNIGAVLPFDEPFVDGCAVAYGGELADLAPPRRPWRHTARIASVAAALMVHGALLLLFITAGNTAIRPVTDTVGIDFGAQGVSLSLVSGRDGGVFAATQTDRGHDADLAAGTQEPADAFTAEDADAAGRQGESAAADLGHRVGGDGGAAEPSATAATGSGFNPSLLASLAPLSFAKASEPDLLPQVLRCLRTPVRREVALNVVLSDGGVFVDVYPPDDQADVTQSPDDANEAGSVIEALKACGPYKDVPVGLGQRLLLVVPQSGATAAS